MKGQVKMHQGEQRLPSSCCKPSLVIQGQLDMSISLSLQWCDRLAKQASVICRSTRKVKPRASMLGIRHA